MPKLTVRLALQYCRTIGGSLIIGSSHSQSNLFPSMFVAVCSNVVSKTIYRTLMEATTMVILQQWLYTGSCWLLYIYLMFEIYLSLVAVIFVAYLRLLALPLFLVHAFHCSPIQHQSTHLSRKWSQSKVVL